jgi:threonine synthase
MGLPVEKFIISTNSNDEVPEFLRSGIYKPLIPSKNCISSAMNVGHPSNLARIVALYGGIMNEKGKLVRKPDMNSMAGDLSGVSVSDDETRNTIEEIYRDHKVILEPHGAIAWRGILKYLNNSNKQDQAEQLFISLETAHPAKFPNELQKVLGFTPPLPLSMTELEGKQENFLSSDNNYQSLKKIILQGI